MSDLIWLSGAQMRQIERCFPLSPGVAQVDDRRVILCIILVILNRLRWRDTPNDFGPYKTIYNRFVRWSWMGVFNRFFSELSANGRKLDRLMINAFPKAKALQDDRGYNAEWFRAALIPRTIESCISPRANRTVLIDYEETLYKRREKIENTFGRIKRQRRIHTG
jgi:putative transposase